MWSFPLDVVHRAWVFTPTNLLTVKKKELGYCWGSGCGAGESQRSAAQIPTLAKFYLQTVHLNRKDENQDKWPGMAKSHVRWINYHILALATMLLQSAPTPNKLRKAGSLRNYIFSSFFIPAVRFQPGTAGYEMRTQPLCYAVPFKWVKMVLTNRKCDWRLGFSKASGSYRFSFNLLKWKNGNNLTNLTKTPIFMRGLDSGINNFTIWRLVLQRGSELSYLVPSA